MYLLKAQAEVPRKNKARNGLLIILATVIAGAGILILKDKFNSNRNVVETMVPLNREKDSSDNGDTTSRDPATDSGSAILQVIPASPGKHPDRSAAFALRDSVKRDLDSSGGLKATQRRKGTPTTPGKP